MKTSRLPPAPKGAQDDCAIPHSRTMSRVARRSEAPGFIICMLFL